MITKKEIKQKAIELNVTFAQIARELGVAPSNVSITASNPKKSQRTWDYMIARLQLAKENGRIVKS